MQPFQHVWVESGVHFCVVIDMHICIEEIGGVMTNHYIRQFPDGFESLAIMIIDG